MKKITISKEQSDALRTYISDNERELHSARYRLDGLSEFVEHGELPPTFLAFEILKQLALANENKFKSNQYLNVVPAHFISETIEVPRFVLNTVLNCWDHFTHSDPTKASFEKSFGFAAPKRDAICFTDNASPLVRAFNTRCFCDIIFIITSFTSFKKTNHF